MNFLQALRGNGEQFIEDAIPQCVKILVSECYNLGRTLMRQTIRKFSVGDGKGGSIIELRQIIGILKMFRYNCTTIDENELRFWVLNHNLISETPEFYREEVVFIDAKKLVDELVA